MTNRYIVLPREGAEYDYARENSGPSTALNTTLAGMASWERVRAQALGGELRVKAVKGIAAVESHYPVRVAAAAGHANVLFTVEVRRGVACIRARAFVACVHVCVCVCACVRECMPHLPALPACLPACVSVDVVHLRVRVCGVCVCACARAQGTNAVGFVPLVITNLETAKVPVGGGLWLRHSCADNFTLLDQTGPASALLGLFYLCLLFAVAVAVAAVVVVVFVVVAAADVCLQENGCMRVLLAALWFVTGGPCCRVVAAARALAVVYARALAFALLLSLAMSLHARAHARPHARTHARMHADAPNAYWQANYNRAAGTFEVVFNVEILRATTFAFGSSPHSWADDDAEWQSYCSSEESAGTAAATAVAGACYCVRAIAWVGRCVGAKRGEGGAS
jgi:hypothetical protein